MRNKNEKKPLWFDLFFELQKFYNLQELKFTFDNHKIELVKVTDINELLDHIVNVDEIPFWAEIWPASIGLASVIFKNHVLFSGRTVLELGSGVGMAGIAAKMTGAKVTQSDFLPETLKFISLNCLRNNVPVEPFLLADWRNFPKDTGKFDFIIGADILYEKDLHGNLRQIFKETLNPNGQVWLADPGRNYGKQFIEKMAQSDWELKQEQVRVFYEEKNQNIDIYQFSYRGNI